MKKLLMMAIVLLYSGTITAQGTRVKSDKPSFIAFYAGPSFPVGAFASKTITDDNAGFAQTGINLNLTYGIQYQKSMGLAASVFYNRNKMDGSKIQIRNEETHEVIPVTVDHWQFYGISAGPMYTVKAGKKLLVDIRIMGGLANVNAPQLTVQNILVTKEEWDLSYVLQGGIDMRIGVTNKVSIIAGADYLYLYPKFKYTYTDLFDGLLTAEDFHQKMSTVSVTAGVAVHF